jgi:hypothetical protein
MLVSVRIGVSGASGVRAQLRVDKDNIREPEFVPCRINAITPMGEIRRYGFDVLLFELFHLSR